MWARAGVPKHPSEAAATTTSSSSDDTDSDASCDVLVTRERYLAAGIGAALGRREDRVRALRELTACLEHIYVDHAYKGAQAVMYQDVLAAITYLGRCPCTDETLARLVTGALKVFPHQKRNQVAKLYKNAMVENKRRIKRENAESERNAKTQDQDSDRERMLELPEGVAIQIFAKLNPVALAQAACSCRGWNSLAKRDDLWRQHVLRLRLKYRRRRNSTDIASSWRQQFQTLGSGNPRLVLPWKSNRVLQDGALTWLSPTNRKVNFSGQPLPNRNVSWPTIAEVVAWFRDEISSDDVDTDSSGSEDHEYFDNWRCAGIPEVLGMKLLSV